MAQTKFQPSSEMIEAAKTVFMAMAFVETIKPIVTKYQSEALAKLQLKNRITGEVVLNQDHLYLVDQSEWKPYFDLCNEARVKAGLHVDNPDHCPLLVAESLLRQAQNVLIEIMEPITKISRDSIVKIKDKEKLIDLTLKLLSSFVKEGM